MDNVMEFTPQGALTPAQLTALLAARGMKFSGAAFAGLPDDLKQHFTPAAPQLGEPPPDPPEPATIMDEKGTPNGNE